MGIPRCVGWMADALSVFARACEGRIASVCARIVAEYMPAHDVWMRAAIEKWDMSGVVALPVNPLAECFVRYAGDGDTLAMALVERLAGRPYDARSGTFSAAMVAAARRGHVAPLRAVARRRPAGWSISGPFWSVCEYNCCGVGDVLSPPHRAGCGSRLRDDVVLAAIGGRPEVVRWALNQAWCRDDSRCLNRFLVAAASLGDISSMRACASRGADNFNTALVGASSGLTDATRGSSSRAARWCRNRIAQQRMTNAIKFEMFLWMACAVCVVWVLDSESPEDLIPLACRTPNIPPALVRPRAPLYSPPPLEGFMYTPLGVWLINSFALAATVMGAGICDLHDLVTAAQIDSLTLVKEYVRGVAIVRGALAVAKFKVMLWAQTELFRVVSPYVRAECGGSAHDEIPRKIAVAVVTCCALCPWWWAFGMMLLCAAFTPIPEILPQTSFALKNAHLMLMLMPALWITAASHVGAVISERIMRTA